MISVDIADYKTFEEITSLAEPSLKEYKTTDYIEHYIKNLNIKDYKRLETGLFGTINVGSQKTTAIRADIDALPCGDGTFKHLCGHNLHTTALLITLRLITQNKTRPKSNLRFIFQPAEEIISGANIMINAGCMDGVDEIYALHVDPETEFAVAGLKNGAVMAGSSHFNINLHARGTHAAYPHKGDDIIVALTSLIQNAQTIVSRKINPIIPSVLSFGKIRAGSAANILPEFAEISGTFRYIDEPTKEKIIFELETLLSSIKLFYGINYTLDISQGTHPVINSKELIEKTITIFQKKGIPYSENTPLSMGGEDFCFYSKYAPSLFIRLGIKKEGIYPLHNPNFVVPKDILEKAVNLWKAIIEDE
ncbi:MAG: M20 family metallopeptidase [Calditerrivibrio sp.]|nr:M20 family metallopeptidase [Calditerrivibrio sp.]